jgi:hypothetical protein
MPDLIVSGNVDTMLGAADNAAIRSAIGLGQTDAPTFLAQSLTGQSLTGTQATSLVDLAATWNTSGTPTAIKLNVTETGVGSNAASLLMDLQVGGVSKFKVDKTGATTALSFAFGADGGTGLFRSGNQRLDLRLNGQTVLAFAAGQLYGLFVKNQIGFDSSGDTAGAFNYTQDTILIRDGAPGILAQRNGTAAQAFRVYNTDPVGGAKEWFEINWQPTGTNSVKIGTALAGGGMARPIDFVVGGTIMFSLNSASHTNYIRLGGLLDRTIGYLGGTTVINYSGNSTLVGGIFYIGQAADIALRRSSTTQLDLDSGTIGAYRDLRVRSVIQQPPATITPASNGDLVVEATSNTLLTFKFKGSDGTVRSGTLAVV